MKLGGFIEQFGKTEGPGPRTMHKKHPFVEQQSGDDRRVRRLPAMGLTA